MSFNNNNIFDYIDEFNVLILDDYLEDTVIEEFYRFLFMDISNRIYDKYDKKVLFNLIYSKNVKEFINKVTKSIDLFVLDINMELNKNEKSVLDDVFLFYFYSDGYENVGRKVCEYIRNGKIKYDFSSVYGSSVPIVVFSWYDKGDMESKLNVKYISKNENNKSIFNKIEDIFNETYILEIEKDKEDITLPEWKKFLYTLIKIEQYSFNNKKKFYIVTENNKYKILNKEIDKDNIFVIPDSVDSNSLENYIINNSLGKILSKKEYNVKWGYEYVSEDMIDEVSTNTIENFDILLAATPITAYNIEGEDINLQYYKKLLALTELGVDGIILKTVYREKDKMDVDINQLKKQGKISAARGYVYRDGIFNTGQTIKENLLPKEIKDFIRFLEGQKKYKDGKINGVKLILSIGSHEYSKEIWEQFFKEMFKDKVLQDIDTIEINARHALRGMSKNVSFVLDNGTNVSDLGVDEYFVNPEMHVFWYVAYKWIKLLEELGVEYSKKLILKLPYRSDLNIIASLIKKIKKEKNREGDFGIVGVSLINTIKSPYHNDMWNNKKDNLLLNGDKEGMSEGDLTNIPQYSGKYLSILRNIAIYTFKSIIGDDLNIKVYGTGGVMDKDDIYMLYKMGCSGVQLGTLPLINLEKTQKVISDFIKEIKSTKRSLIDDYKEGKKYKIFLVRKVEWDPFKCKKCGLCVDTAYCDAIVNKFVRIIPDKGNKKKIYKNRPMINTNLCVGCGVCVSVCPTGALSLKADNNRYVIKYKNGKWVVPQRNNEKVEYLPVEVNNEWENN